MWSINCIEISKRKNTELFEVVSERGLHKTKTVRYKAVMCIVDSPQHLSYTSMKCVVAHMGKFILYRIVDYAKRNLISIARSKVQNEFRILCALLLYICPNRHVYWIEFTILPWFSVGSALIPSFYRP